MTAASPSSPALGVEDLRIASSEGPIVHGVSFAIEAGQVLCLLGESGSGKSLVAQAILGALPSSLHATGAVRLQGETVAACQPRLRRAWWGRRLALLPQEPWLALDPTMTVGRQLSETHRFVRGLPARLAEQATDRDLATLGLGGVRDTFAHRLSGGMAQRAAFAIARAGGAPVFIVDEPTKGLDAVHKARLVAELRRALDDGGSLLVITHDVEVAQALGGRVAVMLEGRLIEQGDAARVLREPQHRYTRALIDAAPSAWPRLAAERSRAAAPVVIAGRSLSKRFGANRLFDDLSLEVAAGERIAITGPSGSGKSTLGNVLLGLVQPDRGQVIRQPGRPAVAFQKLYQDPGSAFAPAVTIGQSLKQLAAKHALPWRELMGSMQTLRLHPGLLDRRPGEVSGGELQRFALLRVLALRPAFVFADEPTSRLDPVIQREVVELLVKAADEAGAALMIVTHDEALADRIAHRRIGFPR